MKALQLPGAWVVGRLPFRLVEPGDVIVGQLLVGVEGDQVPAVGRDALGSPGRRRCRRSRAGTPGRSRARASSRRPGGRSPSRAWSTSSEVRLDRPAGSRRSRPPADSRAGSRSVRAGPRDGRRSSRPSPIGRRPGDARPAAGELGRPRTRTAPADRRTTGSAATSRIHDGERLIDDEPPGSRSDVEYGSPGRASDSSGKSASAATHREIDRDPAGRSAIESVQDSKNELHYQPRCSSVNH